MKYKLIILEITLFVDVFSFSFSFFFFSPTHASGNSQRSVDRRRRTWACSDRIGLEECCKLQQSQMKGHRSRVKGENNLGE